MKWFITYMESCKEGIFIQRVGVERFINVFKPEYLEVSKIHLLTENINFYVFYDNVLYKE